MRLALIILYALCVLRLAEPARAQGAAGLDDLRRQDLRLALVAERMLVANRDLCRRIMPVTGLILHSADQYRGQAIDGFADGPLAIAAIVPGSPGEQAGLRAGDAVLTIAGQPVAQLRPAPDAPLRDAAFDALAETPADEPLALEIVRDGQATRIAVLARRGCRALVEILAGGGNVARSDGRVIQVGQRLANRLSDDGLAVAFAHELAHLVLEHRRRLSQAGVRKGLLGELGSNRRSNRQAEIEADRMAVHLLANAGYDPAIAARFWLSREGRSVDAGLFRSAIYPSPKARAEFVQDEIDRFLPAAPPPAGGAPSVPRHLLDERDRAF